mmetsp:Transcript_60362/g.112000  ORF Transcript_60362/g.112000 Transcript_60362/m.112000 type:complete len:315 (-) Transcript_60362:664-1608(-)
MHDKPAEGNVIRWCLVGIENNNLVHQRWTCDGFKIVCVLLRELLDLTREQDPTTNNHVQGSIQQSSLNCVLIRVVDDMDALNIATATPPIGVLGEMNLCNAAVVVEDCAVEYPWSCAIEAANSSTVDLSSRCIAAGGIAPPLCTRVVCDGVRRRSIHIALGRKHANRADQGQLLKERVVELGDGDHQSAAISALSLLQDKWQLVPAMPIKRIERGLQDMVEGHLYSSTVASRSIVEGDSGTQIEGVLNLATGQIIDGPADSKHWQDRPIRTVGHKSLVDPVLDEELIGSVTVRTHLTNATEHPCVGSRGDLDGG